MMDRLRPFPWLSWISLVALVTASALTVHAYFVESATIPGDDDGLALIGYGLFWIGSIMWLGPALLLALGATYARRTRSRRVLELLSTVFSAVVGAIGYVVATTRTIPEIGRSSDTAARMVVIALVIAVVPLAMNLVTVAVAGLREDQSASPRSTA